MADASQAALAQAGPATNTAKRQRKGSDADEDWVPSGDQAHGGRRGGALPAAGGATAVGPPQLPAAVSAAPAALGGRQQLQQQQQERAPKRKKAVDPMSTTRTVHVRGGQGTRCRVSGDATVRARRLRWGARVGVRPNGRLFSNPEGLVNVNPTLGGSEQHSVRFVAGPPLSLKLRVFWGTRDSNIAVAIGRVLPPACDAGGSPPRAGPARAEG
jgi:hypothetical protein